MTSQPHGRRLHFPEIVYHKSSIHAPCCQDLSVFIESNGCQWLLSEYGLDDPTSTHIYFRSWMSMKIMLESMELQAMSTGLNELIDTQVNDDFLGSS